MESKSEMIDWPNITLCSRRSELFGCNVTFLCWVRQVLTNGSLYVESQLAEEGAYQCRASVSNVGVLLSRLAYVRISCKFILCSFCALFICLSLCWSAQRRDVSYWSINSLVCSLHFCVCLNAPPPVPYLRMATSEMWCWSGERGKLIKTVSYVTVLCTIIMVHMHKDTSSSYRSVNCIGLWSCLV